MTGGSGEGGVEPVQVIGSHHLIGHVTLVNVDISPLTTLSLMAGNGIAELHLQGIVVVVLTDALHAVFLQWNIGIILHDGIEQLLVLLVSEGWRLRCESVEDDCCIEYEVVVIRELQRYIGKVKAVEVTEVRYPADYSTVAVGNE